MRKAFSVQLQCPGSQKKTAALEMIIKRGEKLCFLCLRHSAKPFRSWHQNFFFRSKTLLFVWLILQFLQGCHTWLLVKRWTWKVNRIFTVLGFAPRVKKRPPLFYVKNAPHNTGREGAKNAIRLTIGPTWKKSLIWWCQTVGSSLTLEQIDKKEPPTPAHFFFHSL